MTAFFPCFYTSSAFPSFNCTEWLYCWLQTLGAVSRKWALRHVRGLGPQLPTHASERVLLGLVENGASGPSRPVWTTIESCGIILHYFSIHKLFSSQWAVSPCCFEGLKSFMTGELKAPSLGTILWSVWPASMSFLTGTFKISLILMDFSKRTLAGGACQTACQPPPTCSDILQLLQGGCKYALDTSDFS